MAENIQKDAMNKANEEIDRLKEEAHEELKANKKEIEKEKENED